MRYNINQTFLSMRLLLRVDKKQRKKKKIPRVDKIEGDSPYSFPSLHLFYPYLLRLLKKTKERGLLRVTGEQSDEAWMLAERNENGMGNRRANLNLTKKQVPLLPPRLSISLYIYICLFLFFLDADFERFHRNRRRCVYNPLKTPTKTYRCAATTVRICTRGRRRR